MNALSIIKCIKYYKTNQNTIVVLIRKIIKQTWQQEAYKCFYSLILFNFGVIYITAEHLRFSCINLAGQKEMDCCVATGHANNTRSGTVHSIN